MAAGVVVAPRAVRGSRAAWDALFVALSLVHAAALVFVPTVPLTALALWWNANTVAHNFIHGPFFRTRWRNRVFSIWLSAVLGVPQSIWRARHLRHHREIDAAERRARVDDVGRRGVVSVDAGLELVVIACTWSIAASVSPRTFFAVYLPGYVLGLFMCLLQGHFEHTGGTTSHYGRVYNVLFFNDGYHVEHHRHPGAHWTTLARDLRARESRWPALLRWLDAVSLDSLECAVLRSRALQRFVVDRHERAFRKLLPSAMSVRSAFVVGGGLFPRTAIVLRRVWPDATITVIDSNESHLERARAHVDDRVRFVCAQFDGRMRVDADLVVIPLAYRGDRRAIYADPPAPTVLVHDWIWSRDRAGTTISWLLCKRLNLVSRSVSANG